MRKKKLKNLEAETQKYKAVDDEAEMSLLQQEVVKAMFSGSVEEEADSTIYASAKALLIFGQLESALKEFRRLITSETLRVRAAKNIIRCHLGLSTLKDAVAEYKQWLSEGNFSAEQLEYVRSFLQAVLLKKKIEKYLPKPEMTPETAEPEPQEELFIDILSIVIPPISEIKYQKTIELDVSFQSKAKVNVIVPKEYKALIHYLKVGRHLENVQVNTRDVIFTDQCTVTERRLIKAGPRKRDYMVTFKILFT